MAKDAKGHGSDSRGSAGRMPIAGHPYHAKTNDELRYIAKDAHEAAQAMRSFGDPMQAGGAESKYLDQVNDASTVLGFRQRGGADLSQVPGTAAHQVGVNSLAAGLHADWSKVPNPHAPGFASAARARRTDRVGAYIAERAARPSNFKLA